MRVIKFDSSQSSNKHSSVTNMIGLICVIDVSVGTSTLSDNIPK